MQLHYHATEFERPRCPKFRDVRTLASEVRGKESGSALPIPRLFEVFREQSAIMSYIPHAFHSTFEISTVIEFRVLVEYRRVARDDIRRSAVRRVDCDIDISMRDIRNIYDAVCRLYFGEIIAARSGETAPTINDKRGLESESVHAGWPSLRLFQWGSSHRAVRYPLVSGPRPTNFRCRFQLPRGQ
jgi:hypothetical protein